MYIESLGSGEVTASESIYGKRCWLTSLMAYTNGTDDVTITVYDNATEAVGDIAGKIIVKGSNNYGGQVWKFPRKCIQGIYANVSGTGASCIVEYTVSLK